MHKLIDGSKSHQYMQTMVHEIYFA